MEERNRWLECSLSDITDIYSGYGFPKNLQGKSNGKYPFFKVGDISKNVQAGNRYLNECVNYIDDLELKQLKAKPYPINTIVFAKIGEALKLNRRAITKEPAIVDNNAIGIKANEVLCLDLFLYYFLVRLKLEDYSRATTVPSVRKTDIENINFNLPPFPEQRAIVSKLEQLFSDLDNGIINLRLAQGQLKVYRQAVLKKAFEGELTRKWREQQVNLPDDWRWVKIDSILEDSKNGMKTGPFGTSLKKHEHQASGIPVYGIENIGEGVFRMPNKIFITERKFHELEAFKVQPNDIIISRSGTVGEICAIPEKIKEGIISTNLMRIRLNSSLISTKYFVYLFQGGNVREQVKELCKGSTRLFLNQTILYSINFPLCSFPEQQAIVQQIETRLSVCDKLEQDIVENLEKAEALRQSILKKAFEGKLLNERELEEVRSAPDWEPAEKLLERIKAEKATAK
ncbi:hsdS [Methanolobus psychrophilus R15]|nr:hsdS [Methanolobus psychrophilus R15]